MQMIYWDLDKSCHVNFRAPFAGTQAHFSWGRQISSSSSFWRPGICCYAYSGHVRLLYDPCHVYIMPGSIIPAGCASPFGYSQISGCLVKHQRSVMCAWCVSGKLIFHIDVLGFCVEIFEGWWVNGGKT